MKIDIIGIICVLFLIAFIKDVQLCQPARQHHCINAVACSGLLHNPSAAVQSRDGLVLQYYADNRYYYNHHLKMVEFLCLNVTIPPSRALSNNNTLQRTYNPKTLLNSPLKINTNLMDSLIYL